VRSNVAGAEIMVDGQSKGFTEQANQVRKVPLDQGTYRIQLKKPGYKDSAEQQTEVIANQENQVGFILVPSADSASIAVLKPSPPAIVSFTASQSKITMGQTASLKWSTQNVTEAWIEPGIGTVSPNGAHDVSPGQTTTYMLTAKGRGGSTTAEVLLAVEPKLPEAGSTTMASGGSDAQGIQETMARFKGAYDSMDINALRREWPSLTQTHAAAIKTTFVGLKSIRLNDACDGLPAISGDRARWTCRETTTYVIKGQPQIPTVRNTVTFYFKRAGGKWLVDRREGAANIKSASN